MNHHLTKVYELILYHDDHEENPIIDSLCDELFSFMKIFFSKFSKNTPKLENLLESAILMKLMPIIDFLKNTYPDEVESVIDLTFCMINQLCVCYPNLFKSNYFKSVIKDFFEIEPFKNLYTISKLVTKNNLNMSKYFSDYLGQIFTRNFESMI